MSDLYRYDEEAESPTSYLQFKQLVEWGCLKKVEVVDTTDMVALSGGWYTVGNVYALDLPEESYRVAIVRLDDE